jgi:hypothetical protein
MRATLLWAGASVARRGIGQLAIRILLPILGLAVLGCGSAASPSPAPTVATPTPTADPRLVEPATADEVFRLLQRQGIRLTGNNAVSGGADDELVKRINATYANWPLTIAEYRTVGDVRTNGWLPGEPGTGESPWAFAGLNIVVTFGPQAPPDEVPEAPESRFRDAAEDLAAALGRLLGPLEQRSIVAPGAAAAREGPPSPDAAGSSGGGVPPDEPVVTARH